MNSQQRIQEKSRAEMVVDLLQQEVDRIEAEKRIQEARRKERESEIAMGIGQGEFSIQLWQAFRDIIGAGEPPSLCRVFRHRRPVRIQGYPKAALFVPGPQNREFEPFALKWDYEENEFLREPVTGDDIIYPMSCQAVGAIAA